MIYSIQLGIVIHPKICGPKLLGPFWPPIQLQYIFKKNKLHLRSCMDYRLVAVDGVLICGFWNNLQILGFSAALWSQQGSPLEGKGNILNLQFHLGSIFLRCPFPLQKKMTLVMTPPSKKNENSISLSSFKTESFQVCFISSFRGPWFKFASCKLKWSQLPPPTLACQRLIYGCFQK